MHEELTAALDARDWDAVTGIVAAHWNDLMTGHRELLGQVLNALPDEVTAQHPSLISAREYLNVLPVAGTARPLQFVHAPRAGDSRPLEILAELTSRGAAARFSGRFADAVNAAREAQELLDDLSPEVVDGLRNALPEMRLQWAISLELGGHLIDAMRVYERAYDDAIRAAVPRVAVEAAGTIAFDFALAGDLVEAESWIARMPRIEVDAAETVHAMGCFARALVAQGRLDPEAARAALREAPSDQVSPEPWVVRAFVESRLEALFGDPRAQLANLRSRLTAHPEPAWSGGLNAWLLWIAETELQTAIGDVASLRVLLGNVPVLPSAEQYNLPAIVRAWFLVRYGDADAAAVIAAGLLAKQSAPGIAAHALAVAASVNEHRGQAVEAEAFLASCLQILRRHGSYDVLLRLGDEERDAWESALDALPDHVRAHLSDAAVPRRGVPRLALALSARERVIVQHLIEGHAVAEIAAAEHVSVNTVKSQMRTLYRKLEVGTRREAVTLALAHPELWA